MDPTRRAFFRQALRKGGEQVVKQADARAARQASRWIRPPFAIPELEFLLACTRCGECISACPHQVVFPLAARLGVQVAGTPALDLQTRGCHLCSDWPCVAACEAGALVRPAEPEPAAEAAAPPLPMLARARLDPAACLPYSGPECGACRDVCPVPGAMIWEQEKPRIEAGRCVGCGLCREACIVEPRAIVIRSLHCEPSESSDA